MMHWLEGENFVCCLNQYNPVQTIILKCWLKNQTTIPYPQFDWFFKFLTKMLHPEESSAIDYLSIAGFVNMTLIFYHAVKPSGMTL